VGEGDSDREDHHGSEERPPPHSETELVLERRHTGGFWHCAQPLSVFRRALQVQKTVKPEKTENLQRGGPKAHVANERTRLETPARRVQLA